MYILVEDHTPTDCAQRSSLERIAKGKWWIHRMEVREANELLQV
jgi:hypothetical protein